MYTEKTPVVLAPMVGITDLPFRRCVLRFGASGVVNEMVSSESLTRSSRKSFQRLAFRTCDKNKGRLMAQIVGNDVDRMVQAAQINQDLGVEVIDINMGCPAKKVVNTYAGSALMKDEDLALRIVSAVVKSVSVPVSVKMRLGWDADHLNAPVLAKKFEEAGVQCLYVHGRTRAQMFTGCADWSKIKDVKRAVRIPVLCNGDIRTVDDAKQALQESECDGVMVGRAALGAPWILNQMLVALNDTNDNATNDMLSAEVPDRQTQKKIMLDHMHDTLQFYGEEAGMRIFRKHLGWYSKGLPGASQFREYVNHSTDVTSVLEAIERLYDEEYLL